MSGSLPHRQFSFEGAGPSSVPPTLANGGRRHSTFNWTQRRPVNAASGAQPQHNNPHLRNFSLPGMSSSSTIRVQRKSQAESLFPEDVLALEIFELT
ncbi:hypothetical protein TWF788_002421 [Orbilia oligospora]|uniref:Uncharacterized protein n=1 Tax=Orbilia oligospora TaxID=2813651 RepID=A0A6G1M8U8_ORBOL|nr:hypothetical protein TWF788_002421 [Orbilia oligospora]KAF3209244.1 hypothetical protein TWF679_007393 [Orbilia oligospora]KAF3231027.1 hypothetical protein TWF191_007749 [Orbilia oligospora]KAF3247971.1 hypothetical protein TWF192_006461 [Orbilia oligospora]